MNPVSAYTAARDRFIRDEFTKDGIVYARITDPDTTLSLFCEKENADVLPQMFRGHWMTHAPG